MQKMAKIADHIDSNSDFFGKLVKAGIIPASVIRKKQIYTYFQTTSGGKMQRYQDTAEAMRVHVNAVMNSVREMERNV